MPKDAPSVQAMTRMGKDFKESDSDSFAMIVLEGQQPLGDDAHTYYDGLVRELRNDPKHVEHVQDLWGDRLTAAGAQSPDGKAVYVQLNLAGNQGTTLGHESVAAVRNIVDRTPPPPGVKVYVTGPAALVSDMQHSGDRFHSEDDRDSRRDHLRGAASRLPFDHHRDSAVGHGRDRISWRPGESSRFSADNNLVVLSTFAINLLVALAMAAGTDYGIFFFGRYQEARQAGEDRETAYYTTYRGVAPVVLGSGLTIAGAMLCLSFTRMPIFQTIGVPCAVGMLVAVAVALTLVPAVLPSEVASGYSTPSAGSGSVDGAGIGTAIVRWPAPILVATLAIALVGLADTAGLQDELQRPAVHTQRHSSQFGVCGR